MEVQGKKQPILGVVTFFCLVGHFCSAIEKMHYDSPSVVEEVHVGAILDMGSREGKIVHSCISMALSDFYHLHGNYSTRVVLHSRDSKAKPLHALSAGEPFFMTRCIKLALRLTKTKNKKKQNLLWEI